MMADDELLRTYARTGAQSAFTQIVQRHIGSVYSAALRRVGGDTSLAKDVTQAVFIALARKAATAADHPLLVAWLYTAVRNEAAHVVRTERRRRVREEHAAVLMEADFGSPGEPDWDRLAGALDASIDELDEEGRQAVLLRFMDKLSFPQMAEKLSTTEDAARMRVSRALERLRPLLQRRGIASTSAALATALTENVAGAVPQGLATAVAAGASGSTWAAIGGLVTALTGLLLSPLGALLMVAAAAIGAAIYEGKQTADTKAQLAFGQSSLRAAQEAFAAEQRRVGTAASYAKAPTATAQASLQRTSSSSPGNIKAVGWAFMERHPEVKQAFQVWADAQTRGTYGDLFRQLGLSADQVRQFLEIKRRGMAFFELSTDLGTIALAGSADKQPDAGQAQLRALLGDDGFNAYLAYDSTVGGRQLASGLASILSETDSPLTSDQAQHMVAIFAAAKTPHAQSYDWAHILAQAQGILSASQLPELQNLRTLSEAWEQTTHTGKP
jgi:RNA polymerase sigma factor (sigma-70 family)